MAEPTISGLSASGTYGATPESIQEWQKAQQAGIEALEQRYANPNWFNVAAGFLKPQLGGFAASLGSASQALGEGFEKQRESQLPIAKMRAELAASKISLGKEMDASKAFAAWKASNKPMDEATYSQIVALSPTSSTAAAAKAAYEGERSGQGLLAQQQQLKSAQYGQAMTDIGQRYSLGQISKDQASREMLAAKEAYGPTQPVTPTRPVGAPGTTAQPEAAQPGAAQPRAMPGGEPVGNFDFSKKGREGVLADIEAITDPVERARAQQAFVNQTSGSDRAKAEPPKEKEVIPPVFSKTSKLTPEQFAASVKPQEDLALKRYSGLQEVASDENYQPLNQAVNSQINLIKNNKAAAARVSAVLMGSPLLAAINEGIGLSVNGLSGNIRVPVETFIRARLKPEDQDLAMAMANNYAAIALAKQRMGGVNPNSARNSELGLYAGLTPTLNTSPNAALRALAHFSQDLNLSKAQYDFATALVFNRHPEFVLDGEDPARYSSAMNSPQYGKLSDSFAKKHRAIDEAFERSLKSSKKP